VEVGSWKLEANKGKVERINNMNKLGNNSDVSIINNLGETREQKAARKAAAKELKKKRKLGLLEVTTDAPQSNDVPNDHNEQIETIQEPIIKEINQDHDNLKFSNLIDKLVPFSTTQTVKNRDNFDEDDLLPLQENDDKVENVECISVDESVQKWGVNSDIANELTREGITHFFPVQSTVIPILLQSSKLPFVQPRDLCVSAPTGSGKTLAYAIPIVQSLVNRSRINLRALILLPSRELAVQVYSVFCKISRHTNLKIFLATGQTDFLAEQELLFDNQLNLQKNTPSSTNNSHSVLTNRNVLTQSSLSNTCNIDILVITPGRLLEHLQYSSMYGFTLQYLKYIVLDEADRLLSNAYDHWVRSLVRSSTTDSFSNMSNISPNINNNIVNSNNININISPYVQRLLFSATLTDNPRKLELLEIKNPLVLRICDSVTTAILSEADVNNTQHKKLKQFSSDLENSNDRDISAPHIETTSSGVYALPPSLSEHICITDTSKRLEILVSMLIDICNEAYNCNSQVDATYNYCMTSKSDMILIFTNSVESTHKLCRLLQLVNGQLGNNGNKMDEREKSDGKIQYRFHGEVREMSRLMNASERESVMSAASAGHVRILVSSDQLARGIDIPNIKAIINYDPPKYAKTYVHRAGRTARAGRVGCCITMLKIGQSSVFHKMRDSISSKKSITKVKVNQESVNAARSIYSAALKGLSKILGLEKTNQIRHGDF
jgi:ATP-dependent RNA helicase DDX51/DBP6